MESIMHIVETNKLTGVQYLWTTITGDRDYATEAMNTVYPISQHPRTIRTFEVVDTIPTPCYLAGNGQKIR